MSMSSPHEEFVATVRSLDGLHRAALNPQFQGEAAESLRKLVVAFADSIYMDFEDRAAFLRDCGLAD